MSNEVECLKCEGTGMIVKPPSSVYPNRSCEDCGGQGVRYVEDPKNVKISEVEIDGNLFEVSYRECVIDQTILNRIKAILNAPKGALTETKVPKSLSMSYTTPECTCGAVKCNSDKHSNWCDLDEDLDL